MKKALLKMEVMSSRMLMDIIKDIYGQHGGSVLHPFGAALFCPK